MYFDRFVSFGISAKKQVQFSVYIFNFHYFFPIF